MSGEHRPEDDPLDARLATLALLRREAEDTPPELLEAYVTGELDGEGVARVEEAMALSPLIAQEVEGLRNPEPRLWAAAQRGWEQGGAVEPEQEPEPTLWERIAAFFRTPMGLGVVAMAILLIVFLPARRGMEPVPPATFAFDAGQTLAPQLRFQEGNSVLFNVSVDEVDGPLILVDLAPGGVAWSSTITPGSAGSGPIKHSLIPDRPSHRILIVELESGADPARALAVIGSDAAAIVREGEQALEDALDGAGVDLRSSNVSEPFVTVPL